MTQSPALRFDYFGPDANEVAAHAYGVARLYGHRAVEVEHFALALFEKPGRALPKLLSDLAINIQTISDKLDSLVQALPVAPTVTPDQIYITVRTQSVIDVAGDESHRLREDKIENVHLLLAIISDTQSPASKVLADAGLSRKQVLQAYQRSSFYKPMPASRPASAASTPRPKVSQSFRAWLSGTGSAIWQWLSNLPGIELSRWSITISPVFVIAFSLMVVSGALTYLLGGVPYAVTFFSVLFVTSGWFVGLALHEFGHALAADKGGDWSVSGTAYFNLNPFRYTHIWISFIIPALIFFLTWFSCGVPGPAFWVGFHNIGDSRQRSWAWAGGPIASALCGLFFALPYAIRVVSFFPTGHTEFWGGLVSLAVLQFTAMLFTLIPLPGFDGFGILEPYLPERVLYYANMIRPYVFFIVLGLFLLPVPRAFFNFVLSAILWVVGIGGV